jgi:hypothetical protein
MMVKGGPASCGPELLAMIGSKDKPMKETSIKDLPINFFKNCHWARLEAWVKW